MSELTSVEREVVRQGIVFPLTYMGTVEPDGPIGSIKESRATTRATEVFGWPLQEIIAEDTHGNYAEGYAPPTENEPEVYIEAAVQVLKEKMPEQIQSYRRGLLAGCTKVAEATKGVSPKENACLQRIQEVLKTV